MPASVPPAVLSRVKKLVLLPEEVRQSRWAVSVTRLTILKSLCQDHPAASRFVTYLARQTWGHVRQGHGRSSHPDTDEQRTHQSLMADALTELDDWLQGPNDERKRRLWDLLHRVRERQSKYDHTRSGAVRIINGWDLLLFEYALSCVVHSAREAPYWGYQTARHYAERYTPSEGTGLTASSVPLLQDIAEFWLREFGLDLQSLNAPVREKKAKKPGLATEPRRARSAAKKVAGFTDRQGQFLAFIHHYRKLHRQGPAELDLAVYFRVTPPSVHGMIVKLEELGLIPREPGVARSARVAIPEEDIPPLEGVAGPPW